MIDFHKNVDCVLTCNLNIIIVDLIEKKNCIKIFSKTLLHISVCYIFKTNLTLHGKINFNFPKKKFFLLRFQQTNTAAMIHQENSKLHFGLLIVSAVLTIKKLTD